MVVLLVMRFRFVFDLSLFTGDLVLSEVVCVALKLVFVLVLVSGLFCCY